jgi:bifunctional non-homologous end joining protein LigD
MAFRNFNCCRHSKNSRPPPTLYYVFDILWHKGEDLTENPILERRKVLERILKPAAGIQLGSYVEAEGKALFELTKEKGMEGIIAKRKDGLYRLGKRTSDWLKIKARLQQEFVVGGFTAPKGSRKHLGAVVLGAYTNGKLRHYGYAGSGFTEKGLKDAVDRMKALFIDKCPLSILLTLRKRSNGCDQSWSARWNTPSLSIAYKVVLREKLISVSPSFLV